MIVSEPSNPWVNGVAGLFTTEFYRDAKRYLAPGGLFVQWLHLSEFDDRLLASILSALGENFSDYAIYEANPGDLVVVAVAQGQVPVPAALPAQETMFMRQLDRLALRQIEDITVRNLGTKRQITPLLAALHAPVNSDYYPYVQLEAPRARFTRTQARAVFDLALAPVPILEMAGGASTVFLLREPGAAPPPSARLRTQSVALELAQGLLDRSSGPFGSHEPQVLATLYVLKHSGELCLPSISQAALEQLHRAAEMTLSHLPPDLRRALWVERRWLRCKPGTLAPLLRERLELYEAVALRDAHGMLTRARTLLEQAAAQQGDDWGRFLLITAMLGAHVTGEHEEARRLWRTYGIAHYPGGNVPPHVAYLANLK